MLAKADKLAFLSQQWANCTRCSLSQERNNIVFGYGNPDAPFMIVGEGPGANEDREGLPFVGNSGLLLDQILCAVSVHPELRDIVQSNYKDYNSERVRDILLNEFFYTNVVACRPPENRTPVEREIKACRPRLLDIIYVVDPVLIITAGGTAAEALIGKKISMSNRGEIYDITFKGHNVEFNYPVLVTLHPAYLLRQNDFKQKGGAADKTWKDFLKAMRIMDTFNFRHYGIPYPIERANLDRQ